MATVTFDTLEYANTLKEAAVPDEQAEAQAKALRRAFEVALSERSDELATKGDLQQVGSRIDLLRKDMEAMKKDLIIWLGGLVIGGFVVLGGMLIKLMP